MENNKKAPAVTGKNKAKHTQETAEALLTTIESMCGAVLVIDLEGTMGYGSHLLHEKFGPALNHLFGKTVIEMPKSDGRKPGKVMKLVPLVKRMMECGELPARDLVLASKGGREVSLSYAGALVTDAQGTPTQAVAVLKEVSARNRAEGISREGDRRLHDFIEHLNNGVVLLDAEARITAWNRAMERITGLARAEVLDQAFGDVLRRIVPDENESQLLTETFKAGIVEFAKTGQMFQADELFEQVLRRPNGTRRNVETQVFPIKTEKGFVAGAIVRDITERKQKHERLSRMNDCFLGFGGNATENIKRLTTLCGELLGGVCALYNRLEGKMLSSLAQWQAPPDLEREGKAEGRICTDVIEKGGDEVLVLRNLPQTPYAQSDPNVLRYGLQTYVGRAVKCRGEYVGSICVVYQEDFILGEEDRQTLGIIASAIGVEEERRREEKALRKALEKLAEAHKELIRTEKSTALTRVSMGVAHEIRNPLANIHAAAQLCLAKCKPSPELKEHLDIILRNSKKANGIIKELLNSVGPSTLSFEMGDVRKVVGGICGELRNKFTQQGVSLIQTSSKGLPETMMAVKELETAFLCIVRNALDAMPEGGKLNIVAHPDFEKNEVVVTFSDTGCGIPHKDIAKVFEPFFTTKADGVGLGLCLASRIVADHQGKIDIESEVGRGTKVVVRLPIKQDSKQI